MGVDFKTNGVEGLRIIAIDAGFVSRIKVSPYGYGKVIYIDHPNGLTSVYAHCSAFIGLIDSACVKQQFQEQHFEIDHLFKSGEIPVKKGEVIVGATIGHHGVDPHIPQKIKEYLDLTLFSASIFIFFALKRILFNRNLNFIDLYFFLTNIILLFIYFFLKIKEINYFEYFNPYSEEFLKIIFYNFATYGVITIYKKLYEDYQSKLSGDLISCVIIVSLSTIIFLIFQDLRNFLYSNIDLYILKDRLESFQYRITDLSIGGTAISAIFAYFYFFIDFIGEYINRQLRKSLT
jgi:hypothetical protein